MKSKFSFLIISTFGLLLQIIEGLRLQADKDFTAAKYIEGNGRHYIYC